MKKLLLVLLFLCPVLLFAQVRKVVVKEFENGKPQVIYYVKGKGENPEKIKEEVYFENGNMDYSGEFKAGVENGEWKYYYENGTIKAVEYWKNGEEDGTWKEYHPDGKLAREIYYKAGKKIKTEVKS